MDRIGICPVCNGTGTVPATENAIKYGWYGYNKENSTEYCRNCGRLGMYPGAPDGKVSLRPDGSPCLHSFRSEEIRNCFYKYECEHCSYTYYIDSGD